MEGKPLPVYGDGMQIRDWLHVDDHCSALYAVLTRGASGEVYNIGGNSEIANIEMVKTICRTLDGMAPDTGPVPHESLIQFVAARPGHDRRYAIDASKITEETGWIPEESFLTGINKTIRWYLDNVSWVDNVTSGAYQKWITLNYEGR